MHPKCEFTFYPGLKHLLCGADKCLKASGVLANTYGLVEQWWWFSLRAHDNERSDERWLKVFVYILFKSSILSTNVKQLYLMHSSFNLRYKNMCTTVYARVCMCEGEMGEAWVLACPFFFLHHKLFCVVVVVALYSLLWIF